MSDTYRQSDALTVVAHRVFHESQGQLNQVSMVVITDALRRTGQDALRWLGRAWWPEEDFTIRVGSSHPMYVRMIGFRRIEATTDIALLREKCMTIARTMAGPSPFEIANQVLYSIVLLIGGHYEFCPLDRYRHDRLCEAAAEGGFGSRWVPDEQWKTAVAIASFFEKSLVVDILTRDRKTDFTRGLACEFNLKPITADLLTRLFFRTQTLIAPDQWKDVLSLCPPAADELTDALLPDVLWLLFGVRLRRRRGGYRLRRSTDSSPEYWEWPERVRKLAELLVPYLGGVPDETTRPPSPFASALQPTNRSPNGQSTCTPSVAGFLETLSNPFVSGGDGTENPQGLHQPGGPSAGGAPAPPTACDPDSLDRYYSQQADQLPVEGFGEKGEPEKPRSLEVGFLDSEPATLTDLLSGQVEWFRTRVIDGELRLCRRTDALTIPVEDEKAGGRRPPHLVLCVDSSGSMAFNPLAAAPAQRGKYDIVLRSCYGIIKYVSQADAKRNLQIAAINFSATTKHSDWHRLDDIKSVKKVLLTHQRGGTTLDPKAVQTIFEARPGNCLFVVITDGCLRNVPAAVTVLKQVVEAGSELALLHVGEPNQFTEAVRGIGGRVHIVKAAQELVGLSLNVAKSRYEPALGRPDAQQRSRINGRE